MVLDSLKNMVDSDIRRVRKAVSGVSSPPKPATYMTSNPPNTIKVRGQDYYIHMTFIKRSEAEEEARDLRDHGARTHIEPWLTGYALYEGKR